MRRLTVFTVAVVLSAVSIGCETASNANVNKTVTNANANSNVAVVVNNNANAVNAVSANKPLAKDDYEKSKDKYAKDAKDTGDKIGQGLEDGWLNAKTRAAFTAESDLRGRTINIDVENAVVTLRGTVASKEQETKAVALAKGIENVKEVKNLLKVDAKDSLTNQVVNGNGNTKAANTNTKK